MSDAKPDCSCGKAGLVRKHPVDSFGTHQFLRLSCISSTMYRVSANPLDREDFKVLKDGGTRLLFYRGRCVDRVFVENDSRGVIISMPLDAYITYLLNNNAAKRVRSFPRMLGKFP